MLRLIFLPGHIVLVTELMARSSIFLSKIQGWNYSPFPTPPPLVPMTMYQTCESPETYLWDMYNVWPQQHIMTTWKTNTTIQKTKITANITEKCDEENQPMSVTSRQVYVGASLLMTVMGSTNAMIKGSNRLIRNKDIPWVSTHFKRINCFKNMCCTIASPRHVFGLRLNKRNQKLWNIREKKSTHELFELYWLTLKLSLM